jgi:hypothetical protein
MKLHLHIERVTLDGVPLHPNEAASLQHALQARLAELLLDGGVSAARIQSDGMAPSVFALPGQLSGAALGSQIAQSLHAAMQPGTALTAGRSSEVAHARMSSLQGRERSLPEQPASGSSSRGAA